jgi:hypothetical protein
VGSGSWQTLPGSGASRERTLDILEDWRGKQISFRVRSVAEHCGLKSDYTTKNNIITVNKFPKVPLITISTKKYKRDNEYYVLPANGADVTFSL